MKFTINGPFRTVQNNKPVLIEGKITIEQNNIIESPDDDKDAKYELVYTKLNGQKRLYPILEILEMNGTHMKCSVAKKGYRTFISNRIEKLAPIVE